MLCFSYVVSEILSGVQRETIVDNIHSELIRIAALANDGKVPLEQFYITKVTVSFLFTVHSYQLGIDV